MGPAYLRLASVCADSSAVVMDSAFLLRSGRPRHRSLLFEIDENSDTERTRGLIEVADIGI